MPATETELTGILRRQIAAAGPISFTHFMDLSLFHPTHGYYQQPWKQIGCQGDFYTSVSTGSLFGQLLGFRFASWLDALAAGGDFSSRATPGAPAIHLVESGAHDGRLALDILSWFQQQRPDLFSQLQYSILEPFPVRHHSQAGLLASFGSRVRWFNDWAELSPGRIRGVIFSNELLDAFPVLRLGWDAAARAWFEWRVGLDGTEFAWVRSYDCPSRIEREIEAEFQHLPPELTALLPDGFTVDICPAARAWWSRAAESLGQGKLLTFDYGLEWNEILAPHRENGTLRSFRSHRATPDPLANPGKQDLTAHVNFSAIKRAGEGAGLKTDCSAPQSVYLTEIAGQALGESSQFGTWNQAHTRQFLTLTHPDHLGRSFHVLVQSRSGK